jgi:MFS family permease
MSSTTAETTQDSGSGSIRTLIPARLDRLPWSRFHTRLVFALGVAWILDGLEITFAGNLVNNLTQPGTVHITARAAGDIGSVYLIGEVVGALIFGRLSDRLGRKNLFTYTLALYLFGNGVAALAFGTGHTALFWIDGFRFIAGMGIGGEYAAINSAIDELIPSKHRGRVDIAVNGTYWAGAAVAATAGYWLLNTADVSTNWGWRIALLVGPALGAVVLVVRRTLPESPRWLITHGRADEAEKQTAAIEEWVRSNGHDLEDVSDSKAVEIDPDRARPTLREVVKVLLAVYPKRSVLGATLMITQSFLYNAIFFTYGIVLSTFFGVGNTSLYFIPFALGNLIGPFVLGPLFDSVGRRKMISSTYIISGILLFISAIAFDKGMLTATTQTICWSVIFFFASAGASAAYLTVSEIFPMELRAQAIAVFFAIAQGFGALGPTVYSGLTASHKASHLMVGYMVGAGIMVIGGVVAAVLGINAERTALEDVASPLSLVKRASESISGIRSAVADAADSSNAYGTSGTA